MLLGESSSSGDSSKYRRSSWTRGPVLIFAALRQSVSSAARRLAGTGGLPTSGSNPYREQQGAAAICCGGSGSNWRVSMAVPWSLVLLLTLAVLYLSSTHVDGSASAAATSSAADVATLERLQREAQLQMQQHEEVRGRLAALQASMVNIDAATRALQERVSSREGEIAQLRRDHALLLGRLQLCHARANQSSEVSLALGATLSASLERVEQLLQLQSQPQQTELSQALSGARAAADSIQRHMHQALLNVRDVAALPSAATPPTTEDASATQPQLLQQQQQQRQQTLATDGSPSPSPPLSSDGVADSAAAAAPAPGPAAVAAVAAPVAAPPPSSLSDEQVQQIVAQAQQRLQHEPTASLGVHHTPIPPADPAHPAAQVHFVKELPLHQQPDHIRPAHTPDDAPAAPFPDEFKAASVAALAAKYIADLPNDAERAAEQLSQQRAAEVRAEFRHAWQGYKDAAWGFDELHPISRRGSNSQYYMSLTMVDALDTLVLLGFEDEFHEVRDYLQRYLIFTEQEDINVFETTIRLIGGLLAAYALTGDALFVHQAEECARGMLVAFDTSTGLPYGTVGLRSGVASNPVWSGGSSTMSEVGTIQLEWTYLSYLTQDPVFKEKVDTATAKVAAVGKDLYPQFINVESGTTTNNIITFGARTDSIYEYFLKSFLQSGHTDRRAQELYQRAMRAMETLLVRSTPDGASGERLTFVAEMHNGVLKGKMDHLVCFVPGMLALGAQAQVVPPAEADRHMKLAAKLMHSCNEMYARTPTGLAPEIVQFELDSSVAGRADGNGAFVVDDGAAHCMLRPETVESLFVLYRVTRDPLYREWGWKIFESMRRYARIEGGGYSGLRDVRRNDRPRRPASWSNHNDKMESFALAETFKYLWLLFQPAEGIIDLDQWVLNTEAHPLPILADVDEVRTRVQQEQQQQQQQTNGNGRRLLVEQLNVLRDKSNAQKKLRQAQEEAMMAAVADAAAAAAGDAPAAVLEEPPAPALEESIQHAPPTAGEA